MTREAKKALMENRIKVLSENGKDNMNIVKKLKRQLRSM